MEKEGKLLTRENGLFLNQLVMALEEVEGKFEEAYNKKNYDKFNKIKKLIIQINKKIAEIVE